MVGEKMQNAPVYLTLAQVKFNPIMSLDSYLSGIQESFRKLGFPDFKKNVVAAFNLSAMGGAGIAQPPQSETIFAFNHMNSMAGFALGSDFLTYQVTEYDVFETFGGTLLEGLEIVHKAVSLSYVSRIGVRYLDAVFPRAGETLEQYLLPEVMGLSAKLDGALAHSFTETRVGMKTGTLVARTIINDGGIGFPPDLVPPMPVPEHFTKLQGRHATLDTDAFIEQREVFDLPTVKQRLFELHDLSAMAFQKTVTPHALETWK
jgi:uncharacterized protein (TIGR04255 family)